MATIDTTPAQQSGVMGYLRGLTSEHPNVDGHDIVMIVGVASEAPGRDAHIIEVDRKAFPSDDGRLHPIAFGSSHPDAGEFIWVSMVTPEELRQAIEYEDRSLLDILRDTRVELLYAAGEGLNGSEAESLWQDIRRVGRGVRAHTADTQ